MPLPALNLQGSVPTTSIRADELRQLEEAWASVVVVDQSLAKASVLNGGDDRRQQPHGTVSFADDAGGGTTASQQIGGVPTATIIIEGPTGAGKTFLVESWHQKRQQQQQQKANTITATATVIHIAYGKFNQIQEYAQPYQALVQAMEQLLSQVSIKNMTTRLREMLRERLGSDLIALMDVVPALTEMADWGYMKKHSKQEDKPKQQHRRISKGWGNSIRRQSRLDDSSSSASSYFFKNRSSSIYDQKRRNQGGGGRGLGGEENKGIVIMEESENNDQTTTLLRSQERHEEQHNHHHDHDYSTHDGSTNSHDDGNEQQQYAFDRFAYLFRELLQVILIIFPNFILFIDDIQWADDNSLELLRTIVVDPQLYGILFIMTTRSRNTDMITINPSNKDNDETNDYASESNDKVHTDLIAKSGYNELDATAVEDANITNANSIRLTTFIEKIEGLLTSVGKQLTRIQLQNLSLEQVNELVSATTELSPPTCLPLSEIIYTKTSGNFLFVTQFLESLQRRQLLRYSLQQYRWTWDVNEIRSQTDLADNVAALVAERVHLVQTKTQFTLRLASYLGHSFEFVDVVRLVHGMDLIKEVSSLDQYPVDLEVDPKYQALIKDGLDEATEAGLLDNQSDARYKFAHDSIQLAFLSMQSDDAGGTNFDLRVGVILLGFFRSSTSMDWMLFAAVQVLNRGRVGLLSDESKLKLAKLNLSAAKKACKKNGFFPASDYLQVAIEVVQGIDKIWENQYPFMLSVHTLTTEVELTCGRHERCKAMAEAIFSHSQSFDDRIRAYFALATSLRVQSKYGDALELLVDVLDRMDEKIPRNPGRVGLAVSAFETRRQLAKVTDKQILSLAAIAKRRDRSKMRFLNMLYMNAYYQERTEVALTVMRRMISRTLQLGLCAYSPLAFVAYAHRLSCSGEFDEGCKYGDLATKLIDQLKATDNLSISTFFLACFVDHLKKPMYQTLPALNRGFQVGMEGGDIESAFLCATTDLSYRTALASPLQDLMQKSITFFRQAQAYGQNNVAVEFLLMWQFTANLMGLTHDPLVFDGVYMHEEKLMEPVVSSGTLARSYYIFLKTQCAFYMGEWEEARRLLELVYRHERKIMMTHYNFGVAATLAGVIYFKLYSRSKDAKLLAKGEDAVKFLKLWVAKGAINVAAGLLFVEAYLSIIRWKDIASVKASFDRAIVSLHRCAFRHWEAMACESFAEYALEQHGDRDYAIDYMKKAYELYIAWGAVAKTRRMEAKYADLLHGMNGSVAVSNLAPAFEEPTKPVRRSTWWNTNNTTVNQ